MWPGAGDVGVGVRGEGGEGAVAVSKEQTCRGVVTGTSIKRYSTGKGRPICAVEIQSDISATIATEYSSSSHLLYFILILVLHHKEDVWDVLVLAGLAERNGSRET